MSVVTISDVTKEFGDVVVLKKFDEEFKDGEFVTLLGPSGCGKTTMLRIIAGFERPTSGEIKIDGKVVSSAKTFLPPEKREIGMVFQSYAVWPHMNVYQNVAYPLRIKKIAKPIIKEKVEEILEIVHLSQYAERLPAQLSGGQQQRVALGRALIAQPKLLLLDEPLSNLDAKLRESMRYEIKDIQKKLGITVVYVTHDQIEAMTMSDRVFVINRGVVQQVGTPTEIYHKPVNQFVADFVGKVNFIKGVASKGKIQLPTMGEEIKYDGILRGKVIVTIRPENIHLGDTILNGMAGCMKQIYFLGEENDCRILVGSEVLRVMTSPNLYKAMNVGDKVEVNFGDYMVYEDNGEEELTKIVT